MVYGLPGLSLVGPAVKRAHNATVVDHLASHSQVGSHVEAVPLQGIGLSIFPSENHDVPTIDVSRPGFFLPKITGPGHVIPAIGEWRKRLAHIFPLGIEGASEEEMRLTVPEVVSQIDQSKSEKTQDLPKVLEFREPRSCLKHAHKLH